MFINSINLNTGALSRAERTHVSDETLAIVAPWLRDAPRGERTPLPTGFEDYETVVYTEGGGLVVSVFGGSDPLATFGVAQRSRHGEGLWSMLLANFAHAPGIQRPPEPWLAVAVHPQLMQHVDAVGWLADFEQCIAWAWITRNAQPEPA